MDEVLILNAPAPVSVEQIRARIAPLLREHGATAAYLFGSYARGEADAWSDIDLIVVMPSERTFVERALDLTDVLDALPVAADVLVYTPGEFERGMQRDVGIFATLRDEGVSLL